VTSEVWEVTGGQTSKNLRSPSDTSWPDPGDEGGSGEVKKRSKRGSSAAYGGQRRSGSFFGGHKIDLSTLGGPPEVTSEVTALTSPKMEVISRTSRPWDPDLFPNRPPLRVRPWEVRVGFLLLRVPRRSPPEV
jgi:hypothetical protein